LTLRPLFPIMCTCTSCIALWPVGIIEIVNVARTIWKVEDPCCMGSCGHTGCVCTNIFKFVIVLAWWWPLCGLKHVAHVITFNIILTLSLLMSYIYGAPCKARNFNVVYIWTYVWQRWKPSLSICCTIFQHWINPESFPVSQLCVNTLPATKVTLITDGI
jgi:hypothetical protein